MNELITSSLSILAIFLYIFLLLIYLLAIKKSNNKELTVFNGKIDYIAFVASAILGVIFYILNQRQPADPTNYILLFLAIITISVTIYFSISSNAGNMQHIFISIGAKIFILSILLIIFVLYFIDLAYADQNKDKRFKDGTRGNLITASDNRNAKLKNYLVKNLIK